MFRNIRISTFPHMVVIHMKAAAYLKVTGVKVLFHELCRVCYKCGVPSGVAPRFQTKSAYMKSSCEGRIRGYTKEVNWIQLRFPTPRARLFFVF